MKTGLVLEGGAMRGMFTAGVLDIFLEQGIAADCVVGVSAGALFGVNYLSGQSGRVIRYNKRFNPDKEYLGLRPLLREGNLVNTQLAYVDVPRLLDPFDDVAFQASNARFYAVATRVDTGEPEYFEITSAFDQMDVLRASGSMPLVSQPVKIGEHFYLDGGISDSIPFQWLASQGCDRLIVILTRDVTYLKKAVPSWFIKSFLHKYPAVVQQLLQRHTAYNEAVETLVKWERAGKAFVIRPSSPIEIEKIEKDPAKLQAVYDLGRADAEASSAELKKYLKRSMH